MVVVVDHRYSSGVSHAIAVSSTPAARLQAFSRSRVMIIHRSARRLLHAAAGCSMLVAATVHAQDRSLVRWSGRVDKEVQITIRDTSVSTSINGGAPASLVYFDVKDRMPMRDGFVRIELEGGRGDVDVIQQP